MLSKRCLNGLCAGHFRRYRHDLHLTRGCLLGMNAGLIVKGDDIDIFPWHSESVETTTNTSLHLNHSTKKMSKVPFGRVLMAKKQPELQKKLL